MPQTHGLPQAFESEPGPPWNCRKNIGTGGFAKVFQESIVRPPLGRHLCAVKRIIKDDVKFPREAYAREIDIFRKLKQNEWCVEFFTVHSDANYIYIAMEYMVKGDLGNFTHLKWGEGDARVVALQLLRGLQYLHEHNITHRDLKPANIFPVLHNGRTLRIKIGDFGVSKHIPHGSNTSLRTEVGTVQYTAPEVIDRGGKYAYSFAVDFWSVGCVVYRLIAGEDLFQTFAATYDFKHTGVPSPRSALIERDSGISDDCVNFVAKLITLDPEERLGALDHPWMHLLLSTDENNRYTITNELATIFVGYEVVPMLVGNPETTTELVNYYHSLSRRIVWIAEKLAGTPTLVAILSCTFTTGSLAPMEILLPLPTMLLPCICLLSLVFLARNVGRANWWRGDTSSSTPSLQQPCINPQ